MRGRRNRESRSHAYSRRLPVLALGTLCMLATASWGADARHVIHISLDGGRGDLIAAMLAADSTGELANFRRFVDEGAVTWNARTDASHTITLPNHTTMVTARPVTQPAGQPNTVHHGYTSNSDPAPTTTLHNSGNLNVAYKASVFDVAHDAGMSTALYASKSKFSLFDHSYDAADGAADLVPPDNGTDKIDRYLYLAAGSTAAAMHAAFLSEMAANDYNYCFVHYLDLDAVGHATGWGGATWQSAVRTLDDYLGQIFSLVETDPELQGATAILLTADHGGSGTDHSQAALPENYTIPVLVWGAGIARGADLYVLNPATRLDPGTGRPDYNAALQPIRNGDTGNLALHLLGLGSIPGSTINVAQDLVVRGSTAVGGTDWSTVKDRYR